MVDFNNVPNTMAGSIGAGNAIPGVGPMSGQAGVGSASHTVINISKGAKINLTKEAPSLSKIMVGLGWREARKYAGAQDFDLDASVFCVDASGKSRENWFVFYNNLTGPNGCVVHQGDNRTGAEDGDAEKIFVDLDKVPQEINKIAIVVTIDRADERRQNFGMIENAYCRLIDDATGNEIVHYDLGEDFSVETAIIVGELYRLNGDWKFSAIGSGYSGGLLALCQHYGLEAEYK